MENLKQRAYGLLRRSEHYFKTDMVYLAKGGFWQVFGQLFTSVISLGLLLFFANYLPKETYGTYKYILSIAGILNVFTLTGMNQAVAQAVASGNEGVLRRSVRYQLKWHLLQFAAFLGLGTYYAMHGNMSFAIAMFILGIFSPLTFAFNTYGAFLEGKRNFQLNNIFSILSTLIYAAGMIVAIVVGGEVIWLVLGYSLFTFGSTLLFYILTLRKYHPGISESKEAIAYGRKLSFIDIMSPVVAQIDKIILSHFWGASALAVYSLSMAIPERATGFMKSWINIGLPKFSTKTPVELKKVFWLRVLQGMGVGFLCFLGYYLLAPFVFTYLIPSYMEGLIYSQILAITFIFALPNRFVSLLLTSQKVSGLIFANQLIQNLIRITLYVILGISGGIMGLVIAYVATSFLNMVINITSWLSYSRRAAHEHVHI